MKLHRKNSVLVSYGLLQVVPFITNGDFTECKFTENEFNVRFYYKVELALLQSGAALVYYKVGIVFLESGAAFLLTK